MSGTPDGFVPPPYPYDRLDRFKVHADGMEGGLVDLSIGTPCDPPPAAVIAALASSNSERGYPPSIGSEVNSTLPLKAASCWYRPSGRKPPCMRRPCTTCGSSPGWSAINWSSV